MKIILSNVNRAQNQDEVLPQNVNVEKIQNYFTFTLSECYQYFYSIHHILYLQMKYEIYFNCHFLWWIECHHIHNPNLQRHHPVCENGNDERKWKESISSWWMNKYTYYWRWRCELTWRWTCWSRWGCRTGSPSGSQSSPPQRRSCSARGWRPCRAPHQGWLGTAPPPLRWIWPAAPLTATTGDTDTVTYCTAAAGNTEQMQNVPLQISHEFQWHMV